MKSDVPYLTKNAIEREACLLLAEFARDHRPILTPPVPIDEIIELHLKLSFEIRDLRALFGFGDVHGAIWFRDKLIAVDQQLDPDKYPVKRGRYHFTLAHETGHWRLHRHLYLGRVDQPNLFADEDSKPNYVCRSSDAKVPVEFQADQFAAYLLMPRDLVTQAWQDWRGNLEPIVLDDLKANREQILADEMGRRGGFRADEDDMVLEHCSRPLAEKCQVSAKAMRIRLEDLGLLLRKRELSLFA